MSGRAEPYPHIVKTYTYLSCYNNEIIVCILSVLKFFLNSVHRRVETKA